MHSQFKDCFLHSFRINTDHWSSTTDRPSDYILNGRRSEQPSIFVMISKYVYLLQALSIERLIMLGDFIKSPLYIILLVYKHHRTPMNQSYTANNDVLYTFDQCLNYQYLFGTFNTCRKRILFAIFALLWWQPLRWDKKRKKKRKKNPPKTDEGRQSKGKTNIIRKWDSIERDHLWLHIIIVIINLQENHLFIFPVFFLFCFLFFSYLLVLVKLLRKCLQMKVNIMSVWDSK